MASVTGSCPKLHWARTDINLEKSLDAINWESLTKYAIEEKVRRDGNNHTSGVTCQLSAEFNRGGRNLVRRLDFGDGTRWVARIQTAKHTPEELACLECEAHTMTVVREQSNLPVPELYAYEANSNNPVGVPFMLMEFVPGDTAMDSFGGYDVHRGETPPQYKAGFHAAMADVQVQLSAIRFPKIGAITKSPGGAYTVGPLPKIRGPFDSAAEADTRTDIIASINNFPSKLGELARNLTFRGGPFPLFHTDLYTSNVIIDRQHNILSVIDWENAFVVPWEMVEFMKPLAIVPRLMDGPAYVESEAKLEMLAERRTYVRMAREAEASRGLDDCLSSVLGDRAVQDFAHALWLYEDGRIGYYCDVLDQFEAAKRH